jgi:hypothetical protein
MVMLAILAIFAALAAGLAVKFTLDRLHSQKEITWNEFAAGTVAIAIVIVPLSVYSGWKIAKANNLSFREYWNGWELKAVAQPIQCSRDGPCWYEYDCDPYVVQVPYECGYYTGTGENRHYVSQTCYRSETRYHSCPYVKVETTYVVQTTLGDYTIAEHRFPDNPQFHRWRSYVDVPGYVIDRAGIGEPQFWIRVKERVESGNPGPVTKRASYDNYILASDRTILQQFSGEIENFQSQGLFPELQIGVEDFYLANKVYFVGFQPTNSSEWKKGLQYFNAGFGYELEGDLHLVISRDARISQNPDAYLFALKAFWQNPKVFGKDAISKNSLIVVLGTDDGTTVSWARAITGMPLGNERLIAAIRDSLKGVSLTPDFLLGDVRGKFVSRKGSDQIFHAAVDATHQSSGALNRILWGLEDPAMKFQRVHMGNKDGSGGFEYLANEIELTHKQRVGILVSAFFSAMGVWLIAVLAGDRPWRKSW